MASREQPDTTAPDTGAADSIQGEGDYRSAREYREDVREFLEHADVEKAAREAAPRNRRQARELERAEEEGRSHARGGSREAGTRTMRRSLRRAVRERPVVAILVAGTLGYLVGWVRHRPRDGTGSNARR
jgi:hypothetical protein